MDKNQDKNPDKDSKNKNRTAIKVAELATILYAILVFMSLMIDDAYYSLFQIPIVSYMSPSEILLSCVGQIPQFIKPLISTLAFSVVGYIIGFWIHNSQSMRNWFLARMMHSPSIQSQFSVAARYNLAAIVVIPIMIIFTPEVFQALFVMDLSQVFTLLKIPLIIEGILIGLYFTILPSKRYRIASPFDWKEYPAHEWIFHRDAIRKRIAFYPFTAYERKVIQWNYSSRNYIIALLFLIGIYTGQIIVQTHKAQTVMQEGNDVCVVLEGDSIHVDTRDGKTEYIGECAGFVFVYNKQSHGTMVFERKQIRNYLLLTGATARANASYDANAAHIYTIGTHIQDSIAEKIDTMAQQVSNVVLDIPASYQLIKTGTNHLVWHDSVSNTYIEQVLLPEEMFEDLPGDKQIFKTDIYILENEWLSDHQLCPSQSRILHGQNGEYVRTLICSAGTYTALLFYDPSGQHADLAESIFKTVKLKGNCWQRMALIYRDFFSYWHIFLIIFGIVGIIMFLLGVFVNEAIHIDDLLNICYIMLIVWGMIIIIFISNFFLVRISIDRFLLILLAIVLSLAGVYLLFGIGRIIHLLLPHREASEQTAPETEEEAPETEEENM